MAFPIDPPPNNINEFTYHWREWINSLWNAGDKDWHALTLQNAWVAFGGTYMSPKYRKMPDGMVVVSGVAKNGTTTAGTVIATLPAGYRPSADLMFVSTSNNGVTDGHARLDVATNGNIIIQVILGNSSLSLDSIRFYAVQ